MSKSKLLVVTRHSPLPENDGAGAYLFDFLSYLSARGVQIEVVWIKAEGDFVRRGWWRVPKHFSSVARLQIVGSLALGPYRFFWWGPIKAKTLGHIKRFLLATGLWRRPPAALVAYIEHVTPAPRAPQSPSSHGEPGWSELPSRNERSFFETRLSRFRPNAVLANYCWLTPLLPQNAPIKRFVLTHDVASHRLNLGRSGPAVVSGYMNPATAEGETQLLEKSDTILAISEDDAAAFRAMLPKKKILVVPKAARAHSHSQTPVIGRCLFVGGVNPPNREGLHWFLDRVWPLIKNAHSQATLHVCGGISQTVENPPAGVVLRGRVDNLDPEYHQAEIVVVPLLQGTGIKIKLVEACSYGKACVTTPVGLQGLAFLRDAVIEATDAGLFAQGVISLMSQPSLREELGKRSAAAVENRLSPDRCYAEVIQELSENGPQSASGERVPNLVTS